MGPSRNSFDTQAVQEQPLHRSCPRTASTRDLSRTSLFMGAVWNSLYTGNVREQPLYRNCPGTASTCGLSRAASTREFSRNSLYTEAQKLSSTFKIGQKKNSLM
jgi:hypothetical protein